MYNYSETKYQNQAIKLQMKKSFRRVIESYALGFRRPPSFLLTLSQEFLRTEGTHTSTEDASTFKHLQVASENKMCRTIKNYTSPKVQANYFFNWT